MDTAAVTDNLEAEQQELFVDCRDPVPRKCQVIVPVHDRGRPGSISYQA